jgi:hypothetical protein
MQSLEVRESVQKLHSDGKRNETSNQAETLLPASNDAAHTTLTTHVCAGPRGALTVNPLTQLARPNTDTRRAQGHTLRSRGDDPERQHQGPQPDGDNEAALDVWTEQLHQFTLRSHYGAN